MGASVCGSLGCINEAHAAIQHPEKGRRIVCDSPACLQDHPIVEVLSDE